MYQPTEPLATSDELLHRVLSSLISGNPIFMHSGPDIAILPQWIFVDLKNIPVWDNYKYVIFSTRILFYVPK